jgi:hypothetical protein
MLPVVISNLKFNELRLRKSDSLKMISDYSLNKLKIQMKTKFLRWLRLSYPFLEKKDFVTKINSFNKVKD